jgi:tetratricopeptide (TPR) repeat protein
VYSLGAVLYELLAERPPLDTGGNALEALRAISTARPARPSAAVPERRREVAGDLDEIVLACLRKDREDRYGSAAELARDLEAWLAGRPIARARRRPRAAIAVAITAVALGGAGVAWRAARSSGVDTGPVRVDVVARNAGAAEHAWLAPVVQRMATRALRNHLGRTFWLVEGQAERNLELTYDVIGGRLRIQARVGDDTIAAVDAPAVAQAIAQLSPAVVAAFDDAHMAIPDEAEQREMAELGARSFEAFRIYRRLVDDYLSATWVDVAAIEKQLAPVIALDPGWAHGWAFIAVLQGRVSPAARATFAVARTAIDMQRDPSGRALLEGMERQLRDDHAGAVAFLGRAFRDHPRDLLLAFMAAGLSAENLQREEAVAICRIAADARPDLQFTGDASHQLRLLGRRREAVELVRAWAERHPESPQALIELALVGVENGASDEAERQVDRLIFIPGESTDHLATRCEVKLVAGKLAQAREAAERMLVGSALARARGRYRLGVIAICEGRFATAHELLSRAVEEHRPLGGESELTQALEALRGLSALAGQPGEHLKHTVDLASALALYTPSHGAVARFDAAILERGSTCPSIDDALAGDAAEREVIRRHALRSAAEVGCASCADAVHAGLASSERSPASLVRFGLCAEQIGELALARESLDRASRLTISMLSPQASPYDALRARAHLARVLAKSGDRAAARREYEAFLAAWGNADRPVPEVAAARRELAAL